jgi:hypothetical protein
VTLEKKIVFEPITIEPVLTVFKFNVPPNPALMVRAWLPVVAVEVSCPLEAVRIYGVVPATGVMVIAFVSPAPAVVKYILASARHGANRASATTNFS